ncbi:oxidoreductase family protein [Pseudomassariella vexata]|uniref:Oxidoreductase family protein n=1 Tax=Pseudomassariella vexata TaxID=1141098 RepID=A0A1Y2E863_9PEZI|nr:oxidoreductase family protein [Pseudomassariella vexata]ORY67476.1 oxidoreductase family protein [Pseudomassariella vexata]
MAPIRIALTGLSANSNSSWAASAHLPYLTSPRGKSKYEVVALLNSSVSATEAAIKNFSLPSGVKAYGDAAALAADPDVDLVVNSTRSDVHANSVEPSIRAGKAVFVEWPLAENYERGAELVQAQRQGASERFDDSIIGLQWQFSPPVQTLRSLLETGRIGTVLNSSVVFHGMCTKPEVPKVFATFFDRKIGGNSITVEYVHVINMVHHAIGEWDTETVQSRMSLERPDVAIVYGSSDGKTEVNKVHSDVPDHLWVNGRLVKGRHEFELADNATLAVEFSTYGAFKGQPSLDLKIAGTKGDIRVTSHSFAWKWENIQVYDRETGEVEDIPVGDWAEWQTELPELTRNTAELYERYADWVANGKPKGSLPQDKEWPRLHDAVVRMKELDLLFKQFDQQRH